MMNKLYGYLAATAVAGTVTSAPAWASESVSDALADSETKLHLRTRFEAVDQDGLDGASALTHKTRLTWQSGRFRGVDLLLEMDDTTALTDVDYNDGTGINTDTAVVADPEGTEINQAVLGFQAGETRLQVGRQRILLDNQRFVGGVGWRQNEQTYDGLAIKNTALDNTELFYAYIHNVNRIFGETVSAGDHKHQSHLLNLRYSGLGAGALVAYAYLLDNETAPGLASDTLGLRWEGKINGRLGYNLEYAAQNEAGDNPADYSADYWLAEGVATLADFTFKAGYEVLGSDEGAAAFATPLATLHAFQGWTDKFLATPPTGVQDLYLSAGRSVGPVKLTLAYHSLSADEGAADYGSEVGLVAATHLGPVGLTLKWADYRADEFATDTQKFWLMASTTF